MGLGVYGFRGVWVYGFMGLWVYGFRGGKKGLMAGAAGRYELVADAGHPFEVVEGFFVVGGCCRVYIVGQG